MDEVMELTVNDVIRRWPQTVEVFNRYGIDSCCGGSLPVAEAAARHRIVVAELKAALEEAVTEAA